MESYFDLLSRCYPLLIQGTLMTLEIFFLSACLSFSLGLFFGIVMSHRLRIPILSSVIEGLCFVLRAVPFFVQLLIIYFVFPDLLDFSLGPFAASVIALGLCSSGYVSQVVRAGINSIAVTQWEMAFSLGYSQLQSLRFIILPQMLRNVLPPFVNELDALLKSTSITASIGMLELTRAGMNLVSREMEPVAIYLTVAFFYLCISSVLNGGAKILERKVMYVKS